MSDAFKPAIAELQRHMRDLEAEIADAKRTINSLCRRSGVAPMYADADLNPSAITGGPLRRDQFYGKALSSVVREILVLRQQAGLGPATVNEMYDRMIEGGYQFEAKDEDNSKRGLRISLRKNSATFHKLPGGAWGLREWYPALKETKSKGPSLDADDDDDDSDDEDAQLGQELATAVAGSESESAKLQTPKKAK